jgi:hypothetical protein
MTLPQVKATGAMKTAMPQQLRQLAIQQQLLQQRKLPAQKMAQLTQVQRVFNLHLKKIPYL